MKQLKAKNKEQEQAVSTGIAFLDMGNSSEFLLIVGKAGTGKTTIAQMILEPFIKDKKEKILICALSHKAKLVLQEKLSAAFGKKKFKAKSVAGALAMQMDLETGRFQVNRAAEEPAIEVATIIVVDEGSMINEEGHELIMSRKRKGARVIYLGDIRQLPPIREQGDPNQGKPSPTFYSKNYVVLHERIRQGEESPILPFSDFFGDNSRLTIPKNNPVPQDQRKSIVTEKGALVFAGNTGLVVEQCMPLFKYGIDNGRTDIIKVITYRNETRRRINTMVREYLFDVSAANQFVASDMIMFQDNFNVENIDEPISNAFEVQINQATFLQDQYKVWELHFTYEGKPVSVLALDQSEIKRHTDDVSRLFEIAKRLPHGDERKGALGKAWELKKRFAPVDYAYAITSHKAQGSTYNTVIVDERDIASVRMIDDRERSQSMYTAITRASTTCIIVDGHADDDLLEKALQLSTHNLNHDNGTK